MAILQHSHQPDSAPQYDLMASANFAGASGHMTYNKDLLTNITPFPIPYLVTLPNGYKGPSLKMPLELGKLEDGLYKFVCTIAFSSSAQNVSPVPLAYSLPLTSPTLDPIHPTPDPTSHVPSSPSIPISASPSLSPAPIPSPVSDSTPPCVIPSPVHTTTAPPPVVGPLRRFDKPHTLPSHLTDYVCQLPPSFSCISPLTPHAMFEPPTYSQAAPVPTWQDAMRKEFEVLETN
ncbi:PREDICTED: vegetative cell wall protein gp1-like [Nicotiana attenuata]|uniref:vegetative cell wall protein gp1-like n=1 Tax=Nicotiana attenuata TaxID=49451 RepID=UPI000904668D|nr:PREDICTED: vegetative cell wall protein gp1-like [Nicotiana attenuata]